MFSRYGRDNILKYVSDYTTPNEISAFYKSYLFVQNKFILEKF
jgi:hypothetical protein